MADSAAPLSQGSSRSAASLQHPCSWPAALWHLASIGDSAAHLQQVCSISAAGLQHSKT